MLSTLILTTSLLLMVIESLPTLTSTPIPTEILNNTNGSNPFDGESSLYAQFVMADTFLCSMLLIEYVVRCICCPNKIRFLKSTKNILTVTSLLPSVISGIHFYNNHHNNDEGTHIIDILMRFRIMRVIALVRYDHYYPNLRIFILTMKASAKSVAMILGLVTTLALFYGGCLYYIERGQIPSIPHGMWWAAVTMTTLGYGDMYPTTQLGYCIGTVCVISGTLLLVLPIPVIVANFHLYTAAMEHFEEMKRKARQGQSVTSQPNQPSTTSTF